MSIKLEQILCVKCGNLIKLSEQDLLNEKIECIYCKNICEIPKLDIEVNMNENQNEEYELDENTFIDTSVKLENVNSKNLINEEVELNENVFNVEAFQENQISLKNEEEEDGMLEKILAGNKSQQVYEDEEEFELKESDLNNQNVKFDDGQFSEEEENELSETDFLDINVEEDIEDIEEYKDEEEYDLIEAYFNSRGDKNKKVNDKLRMSLVSEENKNLQISNAISAIDLVNTDKEILEQSIETEKTKKKGGFFSRLFKK